MPNTKKPVVLLLLDYYLPGYKAGGPITTIKNMLASLKGDVEFKVITRSWDLGDDFDFEGIDTGKWLKIDGGEIFYVSRSNLGFSYLLKVLRSSDYDALYLNSFFSVNFSFFPVLMRRFGLIHPKNLILAPRGEFSAGALSLKRAKKRFFLRFSKLLGLHRNILWQSSSELERSDVLSVFKRSSVVIAPDLPPPMDFIVDSTSPPLSKEVGRLKVVFLSRIVPMKGLESAIKIMQGIDGRLAFDIYGPVEDEIYWRDCTALLESLPGNISVTYKGSVEPSQISGIMRSYHLFILPTKGENYGHVIVEALSNACPVLISNRTQWKGLEVFNAGYEFPLENVEDGARKLQTFIDMNQSEWNEHSLGAIRYISSALNLDVVTEQNKSLFSLNNK